MWLWVRQCILQRKMDELKMPLQKNKKRQKRRKIKVTNLSRSVSKSSIVSLHEMKMQEHEKINSNTKACATCFTKTNTASGNQACEGLDHMCVYLCCTDVNAHCLRDAEEDWETMVFDPRVYLETTWDNRERTLDSSTDCESRTVRCPGDQLKSPWSEVASSDTYDWETRLREQDLEAASLPSTMDR